LHKKDPTLFDIDIIAQNVGTFLKRLGISQLSQTDKREKYVEQAILFVREHTDDGEPINIPSSFQNNAMEIRRALTENVGMGYGNKKTDMFIRDMYEVGCWNSLEHMDGIDVASDVNTIKVALRTGILKTKLTPLLSSFLDIFCYQYGLIDKWNAKAWRRVWEIWVHKYPENAPYGPAYLDYFVYSIIGKIFCKESLFLYQGEGCGHQFYWASGHVSVCLTCKEMFGSSKVRYFQEGSRLIAQCDTFDRHKYEEVSQRRKKCKLCQEAVRPEAIKIGRFLPCMKTEGRLCFVDRRDLQGIEVCPFVNICNPQRDGFKKIAAPKSISIWGQTGWDSARADIVEGGGGLMA
jgi:hypothetical protein